MSEDRFRRIGELYSAALACEPADRSSFLDGACAGDEPLRREVESLLEYASAAEPYLESPAFGAAATASSAANRVPFAGTVLGEYKIGSLIAAGGMGEVYRAHDTRLERDVAIKILPPFLTADPDRLGRFRREARLLAALNHPNIGSIFGVVETDQVIGLVLELVDGETLAERIARGAVPLPSALAWSQQIVDALDAAHERGILHRDLKPSNIKIRSDDVVKVLDFGLATSDVAPASDVESTDASSWSGTRPGRVLGTPAYVSPEQARGMIVDRRTDIWAFGCVLFEMLTGRRAFSGDTMPDTIAAVLAREPDWKLLPASTPAALRRVLIRCLEKDPRKRLRDVGDVRAELQEAVTESRIPTKRSRAMSRELPIWIGAAAALALAGTLAWSWERGPAPTGASATPSFSRLTFRTGFVWSAAFLPDGETAVYSAVFEEEPLRLYQARASTPESRPVGLDETNVVDASPGGELALLRNPTFPRWFATGTLARMPMTGGAPRELLDDVTSAAWSPDGSLAVARRVEGRFRVEYPLGNVRYQSAVHLDRVAVSPDGSRVAFNENGVVRVLEPDGSVHALTTGWVGVWLQWAPDGHEVWFSASRTGWDASINAVTLDGRHRVILEAPGVALRLLDVSANGAVLVTSGQTRKGVRVARVDTGAERDLSWLDWAHVADVTPDGQTVLFTEDGSGGGPGGSVYVRQVNGSPAVRIGQGLAQAFSPSGAEVLATVKGRLMSLPVRAGEPRTLTPPNLRVARARWFPDGRRVLVLGARDGPTLQSFVLDIETQSLRPISEPGVRAGLVSPDGSHVMAMRSDGGYSLLSVTDGPSQPLTALAGDDEPLRWGLDERHVYVRQRRDATFVVSRVDLSSGHRTKLFELTPEPYGISALLPIVLTPDGATYFYTYARHTSDLFIVTGLR